MEKSENLGEDFKGVMRMYSDIEDKIKEREKDLKDENFHESREQN